MYVLLLKRKPIYCSIRITVVIDMANNKIGRTLIKRILENIMWVLRNESTDEIIVLSFPVICFQQKHKEWPNQITSWQISTQILSLTHKGWVTMLVLISFSSPPISLLRIVNFIYFKSGRITSHSINKWHSPKQHHKQQSLILHTKVSSVHLCWDF